MERREEKVTIEVTFHVNMPLDSESADYAADTVGDYIADVLRDGFPPLIADAEIATDSFQVTDWTSEAVA